MSDKPEATVTEPTSGPQSTWTPEPEAEEVKVEEAAPEDENEPDTELEAEAEGEEEEAKSEDDESEDEEEQPKRKNRPGKAQRQNARLTRELDELKGMVKALVEGGQGGKPAPRTEQPETAPAPKQEDFQDYGEYIEARAEWVADKAVATKLAEADKQISARQQEAAQQDALSRHKERVEAVRDEYDDFDEVAFSDVPATDLMLDAIVDSPEGPKVQYYLGKHPEEAARIAKMSPVSQIREIGRLEAQVSAPKPLPKTTKAGKPVKPLTGSGGASGKVDPDKLSTKQWMEQRSAGKI